MVAKVGLFGANPCIDLWSAQKLEKRKLSTNPTIPTLATLSQELQPAFQAMNIRWVPARSY